MAVSAVAARSRVLARAVSSSFLGHGLLPTARHASCINRYACQPHRDSPPSAFHPNSPKNPSPFYCPHAVSGVVLMMDGNTTSAVASADPGSLFETSPWQHLTI
ncbi:hypothetical protein E2562_019209 [Oryza meyeriana var. granulata]|uniref:Uncharacterized protein n=1 Tax=Oryza meyeriana var. granulata TaxID=110450 RepID=A0A6G1FA78_9ORYZ|nr:hypothetical protein E2562_019209 [Oryza meyeriana var. granulata]